MDYLAHIKKDKEAEFSIQALYDHLLDKEAIAAGFASKFNITGYYVDIPVILTKQICHELMQKISKD